MDAIKDEILADIARRLADALRTYARERRPDDQKLIAQIQTELCQARREELEAEPAEAQ